MNIYSFLVTFNLPQLLTKSQKGKDRLCICLFPFYMLYSHNPLFGCFDVLQFIKDYIVQYLDVGSLHAGRS